MPTFLMKLLIKKLCQCVSCKAHDLFVLAPLSQILDGRGLAVSLSILAYVPPYKGTTVTSPAEMNTISDD